MRSYRGFHKSMACMLVIAFSIVSLFVAPVQATMVGTADILQAQDQTLARQKVHTFLGRQDVSRYFEAWGVTPEEARARVDAMTDEEVMVLAARVDQVPAGGDVVGTLILLSIVGFIVLIITDIMGVTDVFTFIKKR